MSVLCSAIIRARCNALLLLGIGLFAFTSSLFSQPRSVLAIKHFNSDGVADTLVGTRSAGGCFLPHSIRWGNTGSLTVTSTVFTYPSWANLVGSSTVSDLNGDTLNDIVFFLKGRTGSPLNDVSRVLIIGGGASLNLQSTVNIAALPSSQTSPFYAHDLSDGSGFTSSGVVDPTGDKSWRLSLSFPPQPLITRVAELPDWTMRLYPNPTNGSGTQMEGHNLPPGRYTVSVHSLQGRVLIEQVVDVDASGEFLRILDLHSFANGTYTVRVAGVNTPGVFTYSLVLIR